MRLKLLPELELLARAIVPALGVGLLSVVAHGYVLAQMWAWFVCPLFGLPVLTLRDAMGLSLLVGFVTQAQDLSVDQEEISWQWVLATLVLRPGGVLLFGWLISGYR